MGPKTWTLQCWATVSKTDRLAQVRQWMQEARVEVGLQPSEAFSAGRDDGNARRRLAWKRFVATRFARTDWLGKHACDEASPMACSRCGRTGMINREAFTSICPAHPDRGSGITDQTWARRCVGAVSVAERMTQVAQWWDQAKRATAKRC
eukprot:13690184-Alexandrium_andersonii.AAC.1